MADLFHTLPTATVLHTFMWYLIVFNSRPEAASDFISGKFVGLTVLSEYVKYRDSPLNSSREIRHKAVGGGIFCRFSNFDECRPELARGDVISDVA